MNISQLKNNDYNDTDLHHCLIGEYMNTEDAKNALMIELELKLIR